MTDAAMQQAVSEAMVELQQEMVEGCVMAAVENDPQLAECRRVRASPAPPVSILALAQPIAVSPAPPHQEPCGPR